MHLGYIDRFWMTLAFLREPARWLTALVAVMLGTTAIILADGFVERIFFDFREDVIRSQYGHVQIVSREVRTGGARSMERLESMRPMVERVLGTYPGTIVSSRLSLVGIASFGDRTVSFIGEGVEPDKENALSSAIVIREGRALIGFGAREALLGEGLARALGVRVGEVLTVLANTPTGGINALELSVVGIFFSPSKSYDDRALRLPLTTAQQLVKTRGVTRLIAVLRRTNDSIPAANMLRDALVGQPVDIRHWSELADFYNKTVRLFKSQILVVRSVIIAIVLLSMFNTMSRNVMERTWEIGTMLAIGHRRRAVARTFIVEGAAIGAVGALAGTLLGWGLATLISWIGIDMPPPPGMARGFVGGVSVTMEIAGRAFSIGVGTAVLASLLPALRGSRLSVVDALRVGR